MLNKRNLIRATIWFGITVVLTDALAYFRRGEFVFYDPNILSNPILLLAGILLSVGCILAFSWFLSFKKVRR